MQEERAVPNKTKRIISSSMQNTSDTVRYQPEYAIYIKQTPAAAKQIISVEIIVDK